MDIGEKETIFDDLLGGFELLGKVGPSHSRKVSGGELAVGKRSTPKMVEFLQIRLMKAV